jgi:hypothetical protein
MLCVAAIALGGCAPSATDTTAAPSASGVTAPSDGAGGVGASPTLGGPAAPTPSGSPDRLTTLVTIQRTGGIAGLDDTIALDAQGGWTHTTKSGPPRTGRLTADQLDRLRTLAADPRLLTEAVRPSDKPGCADGFTYLITAKGAQIRYSDCASPGAIPVAANAIFTYVSQIVGM